MFSHLSALAKSPKFAKSPIAGSHHIPANSAKDLQFVLPDGDAPHQSRGWNTHTTNSDRSISTRTTNTNSGASPGVFQQGQHDISPTGPTFPQYPSKGHSSPPSRRPFQALSSASFSMRRERVQQRPNQLATQAQQQEPVQQSREQQQQHQQQQYEQQQESEERLISRSASALQLSDYPQKARFPHGTSRTRGIRPSPSVDSLHRNEERRSLLPRPAPTPLKPAAQSSTTSASKSYHPPQSASKPRSHGSRCLSTTGHSHNILSSEPSQRSSTHTQPQKQCSIGDSADSRQTPSPYTDTLLNLPRSQPLTARGLPTSLSAPKPIRPTKAAPSFLASKSSRRSAILHKPQTTGVQPDSSSNQKDVTTEAPAGYKYNPTVLDDETRATASCPPQMPIRNESPEELIQCLERLIGYDELRLLTHVDQLLQQCKYVFPEAESIKPEPQDTPNSNRKSIGNGILGRLGFKQRKRSGDPESISRSKSIDRTEASHEDRRVTLGAGNMEQPLKYGVFGCPLVESDPYSCITVIGGSKHLIPIVIFSLVEEIYARGMGTPGFMRIAGKAERIDALTEAFESAPHDRDAVDLAEEDIHVLCSLFKRFLRALPEPLMSRELFHILWSFCVRQRKSKTVGHNQKTISVAQCVMRLMPPRPFSLLIYVVAFLSQIPLFPTSKISSAGIAKIFGPALFGARTQRNSTSDERPIEALEWVLENWNFLTEGLLSEQFVVTHPDSPPPNEPSPLMASVTESNSSEPFLRSPITTPVPATEVPLIDPVSPVELPRGSTPDHTLSTSRRLLEWRSNSYLRKSFTSAQFIVDRYEAHDKNLPIGDDQILNLGQEPSNFQDEIGMGTRLSACTPDIQNIDVLPNITEVTAERQITAHAGDHHRHSEETDAEVIRASYSPQSLIEHRRETRSKLMRTQVLVLNEPIELTPALPQPPQNEMGLDECDEDVDPKEAHPAHVTSYRDTMKSLDTLEVEQFITEGFRLQRAFSQEKLCDCTTTDRRRAEKMVKQSIELIEAHQDLLAQMKSQLSELLTQGRSS
ncbi:hypothetical protein KEM48_009970 [Puccinia striiformis f. sp. tritici PST-130]|nr:hypothetical protein KEM48_009970 [Puccinia striiformis f. sp. tritici PST-130]